MVGVSVAVIDGVIDGEGVGVIVGVWVGKHCPWIPQLPSGMNVLFCSMAHSCSVFCRQLRPSPETRQHPPGTQAQLLASIGRHTTPNPKQSPLHVGAPASAQSILPAVAGDAVSPGLAMVSRAATQTSITLRRGHIDMVNPPIQTAMLPHIAAALRLSRLFFGLTAPGDA